MTGQILQHPTKTALDQRLEAYRQVQESAKATLEVIAACETVADLFPIYETVKANARLMTELVDAAGMRLHDLQGGK